MSANDHVGNKAEFPLYKIGVGNETKQGSHDDKYFTGAYLCESFDKQ
jgi:hypothetical protein